MRHITILFTILLTAISFGQDTGAVAGKLTDKDFNNEPLPFANILIKGTTTGTTSDIDGKYIIENLSPGTYTVIFSFVGYETIERQAVIVAGETTTIDVIMGASAATLDQVVIKTTAKKETETALLLDQKRATTIKQSIGAQELSRKGVSDAAGAVTKISGISKQEGGGNVYVRGLGDRYLNTTYNGLTLPANNIEKKNMDLNLFSSDVIQNVGVSKTYAANFYGDFAAGNVDIVAKEHTGDFFLDVNLGSNFNSNAIGKNFVKSEGTGYFGFYNRYRNNPYAVILSHGVDPQGIDGSLGVEGNFSAGDSWEIGEESRLSVFTTAAFGSSFEYRRGQFANVTAAANTIFQDAEEFEFTRNTTAMANVVYRINNNHKVKFNSLFINDATDEIGRFGIDGRGYNRNTIADNDDFGFFTQNVQFEQDMIFVNQILGTSTINEKLNLDYGLGYNKVLARQPDRKRIALERFENTLDNDPSTNAIFYRNVEFDNQRYFQNIEDGEFNARINLSYEQSENLKFNFGYNGRTKERTFDNQRYGYDIINPLTEISDVNNFDAFFSIENQGVLYNTSVFRPLDPANGLGRENLPGQLENTYKGNLNVHALYTDAVYKLGEKWTFVPGLRVEQFNQEISYDVINLSFNNPGSNKASETFFLPSLNVKYALTENQNLRFSASRTVSNPEFKEVAPFVYENVTDRIGGNPDLLNDPAFSTIVNLDLKYEWFINSGEILSLGLFNKTINDPVNLVSANDATGTQRFFRTGDRADVFGIELEARKRLIKDEDENSVLSAGMNITYTSTTQDLKTVSGTFNTNFNRDSDELQGASPLLINADVSYSPTFGEYKPVANLVFSYFSDRIDALGSGQLGNIIEKGVPTLDFVWKNTINKNFEINASVKNILDPTIQRVRENVSFDPTLANDLGINPNLSEFALSSYKRGINASIQFKYKF
ncbi:TonB-dependent receptor [Winogradskyella jejuensis]|uniref:TonB-dependent receptor n=1 Tax=Winogradskyella jejuensis TaxID=1089305 RepID=A0A1M5NQV7_9FLAO|nr:TonB-dependent receptor [Winogradskyella jejuensis]SHG91333.1 TonB-dependent receptor [Winogradskyella jejuensis]